jgi:hypothetical protein
MQRLQYLRAVPDDELLRRLASLLRDSRHTEAELVAHVAEVDARRLYLREATPSMFQYCTERLHLSGPEAYLRIAAARISREHPVVLTMLAEGRLHLTAIALLGPHLTAANRDAVLERAAHKTKREVEEIVAELAPRPDAPALIRRLPERRTAGAPASVARPSTLPPLPLPSHEAPSALSSGGLVRIARSGLELRPDGAAMPRSDGAVSSGAESRAEEELPPVVERPSAGRPQAIELRSIPGRESHRAVIEPLSPARYRVQFTASAELRDKLERLQALMRSSVPDGDLAAIIEAAVTEKLQKLETRRFGRTRSPQEAAPNVRPEPRPQTAPAPTSRYVPADVRRAVHQRDEGRCRYVDAQGRRCTARAALEFHHCYPFGMGGGHSAPNVALLCGNRYMAEIDYGRTATATHGPRGAAASRAPSPAAGIAPERGVKAGSYGVPDRPGP